MFNLNDLKNLQVFLNRVDLKGNEAMAMTELQIKAGKWRHDLESADLPPDNGGETPKKEAPPKEK